MEFEKLKTQLKRFQSCKCHKLKNLPKVGTVTNTNPKVSNEVMLEMLNSKCSSQSLGSNVPNLVGK